MSKITIREIANSGDGPNVSVSIDDQGEYPVSVRDPFSREQETSLEWYFEQWLRFPFANAVAAAEAARSITGYGERLFDQLFADRQVFSDYAALRQTGLTDLRIEVAGSPTFHALHWEALYDPKLKKHLALEATMVRRTSAAPAMRAPVRPGPTINLLLVTARPGGAQDVGYRTITRPLVELLRQSKLPVQVDILRPGSYQALHTHLAEARDRYGSGYYHIVHFDVHGALLLSEEFERVDRANREISAHSFVGPRYGRDHLPPYQGRKAFLFFEGDRDGQPDPAEASEVADLLKTHQIPICILNACQSGKQVGASETSLGAQLMQAGVQLVLAMSYSVTVSAAKQAMKTLYQQLFAGAEVDQAVRRARTGLHADKRRTAYFRQTIELEDWLLPVVYQNAPVRLQPTPMTAEQASSFFGRQARQLAATAPTYGFIGRDLDILAIERRLLRQGNLVQVRGMGGAGKTTLLRHLSEWWQITGLVDQVFEFAYDQRAWTRQQILDALARGLLTPVEYVGLFQPMGVAQQQALITARLRATRHLLILDNLESITGAELAIRHTLPEDERTALRGLLAALTGGQTLVLLGSRAAEEWLAPATFGANRYDLPGLDAEAAAALAEAILTRQGGTQYRGTPELERLLKLLGGFPLALEVVLPNLARQTPTEILAALETGNATIDPAADAQDKTRSILRCIDYSFSNLDPQAQTLLTCLAPFVGVIFTNALPLYIEKLKEQPALADLPLDHLPTVVQAAVDWGLLAPHPQAEIDGYLSIQPTLPYFLRNRLRDAAQPPPTVGAHRDAPGANDYGNDPPCGEPPPTVGAHRDAPLPAPQKKEQDKEPRGEGVSTAIALAFVSLYQQWGGQINGLITAKESDKRQLGLALAGLEYENLLSALDTALAHQLLIAGIYEALDEYWDATQEHQRGIAVGERARTALAQYPAERLRGEDGFYLMRVSGDVAQRQIKLRMYQEAAATYLAQLPHIEQLQGYPEQQRGQWKATVYHQLGYVAQEQRQWLQAEHSYQQALALTIEFNDRYSQASTYHQLGRVAQEQRQWPQAREYLMQDLTISAEFSDEHGLGITLQSLARLRTASGDESLAAAVAQVLGVSVEEVERRFESLRH